MIPSKNKQNTSATLHKQNNLILLLTGIGTFFILITSKVQDIQEINIKSLVKPVILIIDYAIGVSVENLSFTKIEGQSTIEKIAEVQVTVFRTDNNTGQQKKCCIPTIRKLVLL